NQVVETLLVAREPEEIVLLLDLLRRCTVLRAQAIYQLGLGIEELTADTVEAVIGARIDVAAGGAGRPQLGDPRQMAGIDARTDEIVVREIERRLEIGEVGGVARHQLGGGNALLLGGTRILEAVVVGAGQKEDLLAELAVITSKRVGEREFERVAD